MSRYIQRLLIAFIFSSTCFLGTVYWYKSTSTKKRKENKEPIAQLKFHINEVQRKPLTRLIWEEISKNENLYSGEAIRTSEASEAKILFIKTDTLIELEPDSLIVLEENENGIALDFLKGNLFVKSSGQKLDSKKQITLKSNGNDIKLKNAELSLSKTDKGEVDLQVFKGEAELKKGNKKIIIDKDDAAKLTRKGVEKSKQTLKPLSPLPGAPVYIVPPNKRMISFSWKPLPPNYTVFLEVGRERDKLIRYHRSANGEKGSISAPLKPGKIFWSLNAISKSPKFPSLKSKILHSEIVAKLPPTLLAPKNNENLNLDLDEQKILFKWANRINLEDLIIEVAKDKNLTQKIIQKPLNSKVNFASLPFSENGTFFWRITGFMENKGKLEPISSEIKKFHVKIGSPIDPPILKTPLPKKRISYDLSLENGILLSWDPVTHSQGYEITVFKNVENKYKKIKSLNSPTSNLNLNKLDPGEYSWFVQSQANNKKSKRSETRTFIIEKIPRVKWARESKQATYYYYTSQPSLFTRWKPESMKASKWRFKLQAIDSLEKSPIIQTTKSPYIKMAVPVEGKYKAEVEAVGLNGQILARSSTKIYNILKKPLLQGPNFSNSVPQKIKSSGRGHVDVEWRPVNEAKKYKVLLKSPQGKIVQEKIVNRNLASLSGLKPGQYKISVQSIDQHKRSGPEGEIRDLEVPAKSSVQAPKLKMIKVK